MVCSSSCTKKPTDTQRFIADVAVRQSAAADVVAQDLVFAGKNIKPGTPGKTSPLVLKVGDPGRRHHQRGTCATDRIRQAHAIRCRTETYTLIHHPRPVDPTEAYHLGGWGALHQHAPFRPRDREGGSPDPRPDDCSWPILLKKSLYGVEQSFSASCARFPDKDAGDRMAERRRDVGRSKWNCEGNKSRL